MLHTIAEVMLGIAQFALPFTSMIGEIPYRLIELANNGSSNVISLANVMTATLESLAKNLATTLGQGLQAGGTAASQFIGAAANLLKVIQLLPSAGSSILGNLGNAFRDVITGALNTAETAGASVLNRIGTVAGGVANTTGAIAQGASKVGETVASGVLNTAAGATNEVIKSANEVTKLFAQGISGFLG